MAESIFGLIQLKMTGLEKFGAKETSNGYVTLNLMFLDSHRFKTVCNNHFWPSLLPLCNKFEIPQPPDKLRHYIILQRITKLGKKITLFTDDTHLL